MFKKILITFVLLIVLYFVTASILTVSGICPKSIDAMPRPAGREVPDVKAPNENRAWYIFCPFAEKLY